MKTIKLIFSPFVFLFNLPNKLKSLNNKVELLEKQLEHYEKCTDKDFKNLSTSISYVESISKNNKYEIKSINTNLERINLSADVCPSGESWAVLSYKTKSGSDIVKFYDLHGLDYKGIERYMEDFKNVNRTFDAPRFEKLK